MAIFRKKPVEIEAVLNDGQWGTIVVWMESISETGFAFPLGSEPPITRNPDGTLTIKTLEGDHLAIVGDWIIRGVAGEFYPVKPDIFEQTYEAV